jgi:chaperone required for assembly of F1-ATPase
VKRFYKEAAVAPRAGAFAVELDGRPVRTPGRRVLAVPSEALAEAIAEEWKGQGDEIDPCSMPLTGLANAAIDRAAPEPAAFAATLTRYAESDLLCYRADGPAPLVRRQAQLWDPLLAWARQRFGVEFEIVEGVIHRHQPEGTPERLAEAVADLDAFRLAALSPLVTVSGSLVIALALAEGAAGLEDAWSAATLDEAWQAEQWGDDPLAAAAHDARRRDFDAAYRFLTLL